MDDDLLSRDFQLCDILTQNRVHIQECANIMRSILSIFFSAHQPGQSVEQVVRVRTTGQGRKKKFSLVDVACLLSRKEAKKRGARCSTGVDAQVDCLHGSYSFCESL